jgi:hypothetical protein
MKLDGEDLKYRKMVMMMSTSQKSVRCRGRNKRKTYGKNDSQAIDGHKQYSHDEQAESSEHC